MLDLPRERRILQRLDTPHHHAPNALKPRTLPPAPGVLLATRRRPSAETRPTG
ncbi:hypothetical protein [Rhodocaloribacter sp.]